MEFDSHMTVYCSIVSCDAYIKGAKWCGGRGTQIVYAPYFLQLTMVQSQHNLGSGQTKRCLTIPRARSLEATTIIPLPKILDSCLYNAAMDKIRTDSCSTSNNIKNMTR